MAGMGARMGLSDSFVSPTRESVRVFLLLPYTSGSPRTVSPTSNTRISYADDASWASIAPSS